MGERTSNKYLLLYLILDRKHIILCGTYATYTSLQHCNYLEVSYKQRMKKKKKKRLTAAGGGHEVDGPRGCVGVRMFCGWVQMWIPVKKRKKQQEREKKKVHTARGGRERADGPCGSGVVQACGWAHQQTNPFG